MSKVRNDIMSNTGKELMQLLKEIYNNKDFVCGAMSVAGSEDAWEKMRDYIMCARENGHQVTSDDILALSLFLKEESLEML